MRAVVWHGRRDVRVDEVPDPVLKEDTDAIIKVTSTALCGSDLHLYDLLGAFMTEGDVLGHEPMGVVEEVGPAVQHIRPGDRVVVPFNISCGSCFMCDRQLYAQCETTQNHEHDTGASLFGYTKLYGQVPGGQAEYLRVPQAHFGPIPVPKGPPDERFLFLSDVLPTAYQGVAFADVVPESTLLVLGLGPIGQMAARIARQLGARVIGSDFVPERLAMARRHGIETIDRRQVSELRPAVAELTSGRGADAVIDAVGMEAHGSAVAETTQKLVSSLPDPLAGPLMQRAGVDRMIALNDAFSCVRRGGTVSVSGVYAGSLDPVPMLRLFDKGITIRMGQAHVKAWTEVLLPLVTDESDPLGLDDFVTHTLPLEQAPQAYDMFQKKREGAMKVVFKP